MRKTSFAVVTFGLLSMAAGLAAGCGKRGSTCEENLNCGTGGGASSTSSSTGTAGNGGGSGGSDPGCEGDPTTDADIVTEACGVFVSAGAADGGDGSRAKPFNKLSLAVTEASNKHRHVYACAEAYTETLTLVVNDSLAIYGGFDCNVGWAWDMTKRATLTGPEEQMAMRLTSNAGTIHVENVNVIAPSATKTKGASSIAVYVDGGTALLRSCDLTAGDAMDGEDGTDAPSASATDGANGNIGANACLAATQNGAPQVVNSCGSPDSIGGKGGDGNLSNGGAGQAGLPGNGGGQAGAGDDGTVGWTCAGKGGKGGDGLPGGDGPEGAGALVSDFGTLTTSGFVASAGGDGLEGTPGQGGGGGGGVRGSVALCAGKPSTGGASGGSGGSGGCGGLGGNGGKGGGSSIALVSAGAKLTLANVKLDAGDAGTGGAGGKFQPGGAGSLGGAGGTNNGTGLPAGCNGGAGAAGGNGGPGGGGRGGHSLGIASTGTPPQLDPANITIKGAGTGGLGGNANFKNNQGANGNAAKCWDVMTNQACP